MSLEPLLPLKPGEFDEICGLIKLTISSSGSSVNHQTVLKRCLNYLKPLDSRHWFCDPYIYPIASHSLILFSFPETEYTSWIKPVMAKCLLSCRDCVCGFDNAKYNLYLTFVVDRLIDVKNVEKVLQMLRTWQLSLIKDVITGIHDGESSVNGIDIKYLLSMCLSDPDLVESSVLSPVWDMAVSQNLDLGISRLNAGILRLAFTGSNPRYIDFLIERLDEEINFDKRSDLCIKEFSVHLYSIQDEKFYSEDNCVRFWKVCNMLLEKVDPEFFAEFFNAPRDIQIMSKNNGIRYATLTTVLSNHLRASINSPLPHALLFLSKFLSTLGSNAWKHLLPTLYLNFLDFILPSRFLRLFLTADDRETAHLCLSWMLPFIDSLSGSSKVTSCCRISIYLFKVINDGNKQLTDIQEIVLQILNSSSSADTLDPSSLSFELEALSKRDIRAVVDDNANQLFAILKNGELEDEVLKIISASFVFDSSILSFASSLLVIGQQPKIFDTFPLLWSSFSLLNISSNQRIAQCLFRSLSKACNIVKFETPKNQLDKGLLGAMKTHNTHVDIITSKINAIMEKVAMLDPQYLLEVLNDPNVIKGFWSCMFSLPLSQNTLDIVYQAFDVEGRFEGIQSLLNSYLIPSLDALCNIIESLTLLQAFEPSPKAVRLLMDVLQCLTDPVNSVLGSSTPDQELNPLVVDLWKVCWKFLVMLYQKTLKWASAYHSNQLVEFTRDTLDLSHLLIDSAGFLLDLILDQAISKQFTQDVLDVFDSIIVWLRLGDPSLLSSCVDLVFKGITLSKNNGLLVKQDTLVLLIKYAVKAKKYNNKLTQSQRDSIIAEVRSLDSDLADAAILEFTPTKSTEKPAPAPAQAHKFSGGSSASNTMKQLTLARFGVVSKTPPVAPAPEVEEAPKSSLDLLRQQLKSQRHPFPNAKPPTAPAAPRPAGFNSKKVAVGRSLNSLRKRNDDSSDEEDDVDTSDLFIDKKKKSKVVEIDIHGNPIRKIAAPRGINKQQLEQQRMLKRLHVDLKGLYHRILKWNFNSLVYPMDDMLPKEHSPDTYENVKDYVKYTEPLLLLECWAGIQSVKERGDEKPFDIFLGTRLSCDGFFDLICTIKKLDIAEKKITESDLIVLSATNDSIPPDQLSLYLKHPSTLTCLGKIKLIKYFNQDAVDVTIRVSSTGPMLSSLSPKSTLVGMKAMQMVTIEREYSSLKGLEFYDLCPQILLASPTRPVDIEQTILQKAMSTYQVNMSQANAILGTQSATGFSLIQGPPGTGKTKTILGIVGYNLQEKISGPVVHTVGDSRISKDEKVLICAPSNAAVDELVLRLKDGVLNSEGKLVKPNVVRLGRSDAVNSSVKEFTLEELVEKQLAEKNIPEPMRDNSLKQEHIKLTKERKDLIESKKNPSLSGEQLEKIETKIRDITRKRNHISQQLDSQRENATIAHRTKEIERKLIQESILNNAQILCSTLSGSAHDFVSSLSLKFNKVIIDEACQCVELSSIIPLRYGCNQCIMVGDPNQLPPTVLSQAAAKYDYDQSLFVRMQKKYPDSVYLLDVQYRMHPDISTFPSKNFYDGKLKDGDGMFDKNTRPWHKIIPLSPYRFFDITSSHLQNQVSRSLSNTAEANVVLELVDQLMNILPSKQFSGLIGIISPYKEQVRLLKRNAIRKYGELILNEIDFNTVDGFQGQEKDIIIMSCVRASENGGVGFLSDVRRMNVALTRAKSTLWILGNANSLRRNINWNKLISDASERKCLTPANPGFLKKIFDSNGTFNTTYQEVRQELQQEDTKEKISEVKELPKSIPKKRSPDNEGTSIKKSKSNNEGTEAETAKHEAKNGEHNQNKENDSNNHKSSNKPKGKSNSPAEQNHSTNGLKGPKVPPIKEKKSSIFINRRKKRP